MPSREPTPQPSTPTRNPTKSPTPSPTVRGSRNSRANSRKNLGKMSTYIGISIGVIALLCCVGCVVHRRMVLRDHRRDREASAMMHAASRSPLVGMRVMIINLPAARAAFNGKHGVAERWNNETQCYTVALETCKDTATHGGRVVNGEWKEAEKAHVALPAKYLKLADKNDEETFKLTESLEDLRAALLRPIIEHGMTVDQIFGHIDGDGNETISAEEFFRAVKHMQEKDEWLDVDPEKAFAHIDKDKGGSLTVDELKRFLGEGTRAVGSSFAYEFIFVADHTGGHEQYWIEVKKNTLEYAKLGPFPHDVIASQAMTTVPEFLDAIEEGNFQKKHVMIDVKGRRFNAKAEDDEKDEKAKLKAAREKRKKKKKPKFRLALGAGKGTLDDLRKALMQPIRDYGLSVELVFGHMDADKDATISAEEFYKAVNAMQQHSDLDIDAKTAFRFVDKDGSGSITIDELKRFLEGDTAKKEKKKERKGSKKKKKKKRQMGETAKRRRNSNRAKRKKTLQNLDALTPDDQAKLAAAAADAAASCSAASRKRAGSKKKRGRKKARRRGTKALPSQPKFLNNADGPSIASATKRRMSRRRNSLADRLEMFKQRKAMRDAAAASAEEEAAAEAASETAAEPAAAAEAPAGVTGDDDDDMVIDFG